MTGKEGPNVIIEMLANANLAKDLEMIAKNGRIAVGFTDFLSQDILNHDI